MHRGLFILIKPPNLKKIESLYRIGWKRWSRMRSKRKSKLQKPQPGDYPARKSSLVFDGQVAAQIIELQQKVPALEQVLETIRFKTLF